MHDGTIIVIIVLDWGTGVLGGETGKIRKMGVRGRHRKEWAGEDSPKNNNKRRESDYLL